MKRKKYSFKKATIFIFLLFLIGYGFASSSYAADKQQVTVLESSASVEIQDNNLFNAREAAIKECQAKAVKQALYKIMSEKNGIYETEALKEKIYNNPEQFVKSYKILYETSYGKYYTVTTSIDVLSYNLLKKLNITETKEGSLAKIKIIVEIRNSIKTSSASLETGETNASQEYDQNISSAGYKNLYYFVQFDKKLNGIKNIRQAVITEMTPSKREFSTLFQGNAQNLADALMLIDFNTFEIGIDKIEADTLKVNIIKKP